MMAWIQRQAPPDLLPSLSIRGSQQFPAAISRRRCFAAAGGFLAIPLCTPGGARPGCCGCAGGARLRCPGYARCNASDGYAMPSIGFQRDAASPLARFGADHASGGIASGNHRRRVSDSPHALGGGGSGGGGGKIRRVFVCSKCGTRHSQYHGKCGKCGGFGTIDAEGVLDEQLHATSAAAGGRAGAGIGGGGAGVQALERVQRDAAVSAAGGGRAREGLPYTDGDGGSDMYDGRMMGWVASGGGGGRVWEEVPLSLRDLSHLAAQGLGGEGRIPLSGRTGAEVQRALGGGVVPGALVLLGGDPGVGKSTLTLQIAAMVAHPEIDFDALEEQQQLYDEYDGEGEYGTESGNGVGRGVDGLRGAAAWREGSDGGADPRVACGGTAAEAEGWRHVGVGEYTTFTSPGDGGGGAAEEVAAAAPPAPTPPPPSIRRTVLYVTAEETRDQVVARSRRMGLDGCDRVVVLCRSEMSSISRAVLQLRPDALVMDSINTVYLSNFPQAPGTVTQIRECGQLLLRLAKDHRIAVFIIGHVTKGGEMAGPNMLAHMVDTVLYLEGDVAHSVRLLRVVKNRHGSDAECGVFAMDGAGLHAVANHSALFLENRLAELQGGGGRGGAGGSEEDDGGASSVVGVTLQGSRAILVEVQALVSPLGDRAPSSSSSSLSYRSATGVDKLRLANLCAILDKHVPTLELSACSVIVNVVGGAQVRDVASDLALAVAIAASYFNVPVPRDLAVCGEVDLAGRVRRSFQRLDVRLREAAKLGFRRVVIPQTNGWERLARDPQLVAAGVGVVAVHSVAEALRAALGSEVADHRPPHIKPPPRGKPPLGGGIPGSRFSAPGGKPVTVAEGLVAGVEVGGAWPHAGTLGGAAGAYAAATPPPPGPIASPRGAWPLVGADADGREDENGAYGE